MKENNKIKLELCNSPISKKWSPRQRRQKFILIVRQHTTVEEPQVEGDDAVVVNFSCFGKPRFMSPVGIVLLQVGVQLQRHRWKIAIKREPAHKNTNNSSPNDSEGLSILSSLVYERLKK